MNFFNFIASGVCLLALAVGAQAGTATYSTSFSFPLSPGNQNVTLPQFDDAGGTLTLTKVILDIDGTIGANIKAENDSTLAGNMGVDLTGLVWGKVYNGATQLLNTAFGISQSSTLVSVAPTDGNFQTGPDFHDFGFLQGTGSDSDTLTTGLSYFIGTGTITVQTSGSGGFSVTGVTDSGNWVSNFAGSGIATITYEFVPEPATMSMLVLGGLGMLIRRKK